MKKRVISLFMAFCMVFTMLPTAAFATTANDTLAALDSGVSSTLDSGATSDEVISLCRLYLLARHAAEQPDATEEQQTRLERLEENFEKAFSPIRARYEEYTELSSAEREDETVLAEYADVIELYRAVDRMLSGDYDCTCGQRCTEEEHSDDCLRCVIDGIDNCAAAQTLLKTMSAAEATEQFSLRTGKTYYFDLSSEKANLGATPTIYDRHIDPSLHYVPFTYVGTINAYSLENSDIGTATTEARAAERLYEHSLFVAEYPISNKMSWELLKTRSYVFGKEFGTNYILRSLSVGSDQREPATNEWDVILEKDSASIKYADRGLATMGQDTNTYDNGYYTLRGRNDVYDYNGLPFNLASDGSTEAFRPALEVTWEGELDENLLKEVTLKLNGGMAFYETNDLSIVCTGDTFIAPASDIFLKDYQPVTDFHWLGSDNKAYAVGDEVPSTVTSLTAQWSVMPAATGQVWNGTSAKYFDGGTGTEADPYQIRTAEQFALLADVINGGESKIVTEGGVSQTYAFLQSACYKQTADIVLNDTADWQDWDAAPPTNSWKPIGTSYKYFSGAFDGDGFTVSGAFFKDETLYLWNGNNGGSFTGLFGYAKDATIKNVTVAESFIKGYERVGGLVGYVGGNGIVENCQNYGTVEGQSQVGGMVGNNDCTVQSLQNYGSVNGYLYVGGVVGGNSGLLKESQNHGAVSGEGSIGGVAGNNMEADAQILDCINAGAVSGTAEYGGVVGIFNKGSVTNSRSPVGLVQDATGDVGVPNLPSSEHYCIGHIIGRGTNGTGNSSDKIEAGVAITPGAVIVAKGGTQQFVANAEAAVTWSVLNDDAQVSIDEDGKLTLTADAADGTIYVVKAMLDDDNTKFGTATVTVESSPSYEAAWGLAKADGAAPDSWVGTGTLVDAMNYAMYLYSGTAYIRLFTDVDTTATIDIPFNKTTILDLNGYTIDAKQGAFSVLSVRGDLTLHDTSAGGTGKITGGNTPHGGGGVSVSNGGNLTMTGGSITGNAAYNGGGVNLQGGARFIMTGGTITGNTTKMGGGIYAMPEAAFTMTGGEISGNTATMGVGGVYVEGVYDEVAAAQMTVGGTARVTGNQASSGDNAIVSNVQLAPTAILTVSSSVPLAEGASISVRKSITSGATTADVTSTNDSDVSGYFTSDSDKRSIQNGTGNIVQLVAAPTYEAQWREQNDSAWTSGTLAEAVSFANTLPENYSKVAIIKLLNDVTTTQTLEFAERNTTTELDLNGKTIDANGGAFPVLTVRHNFVLGDDSTTDVTKQGKITGSNNTDGIGGGIAVEIGQGSIVTTDQWSFIIQGGNITGNTAKDGGGIGVDANCNFIMNGGNVSGNTATSN
ncbi:MAG TPA: hypothetical protein VN626_09925, partial [Clostridia bacterium]|nr:hypothetical protein [Clostridia bacterium]